MVSRSHRLAAGLPTALDLLVLSIESGQALDTSLYEASKELRRPFPDLADEFHSIHLALRASTSRADVFREFGFTPEAVVAAAERSLDN